MPAPYAPPYTITLTALSADAEIAGLLGRLEALGVAGKVPVLRRENRIRSIHSSLAIENNTLPEKPNSRLQKYRLTANQWSERKRGRSRLGWPIETENRDYKASQPNQI